MKKFYQMANKVLQIKKNNQVVSKVKTDGSVGDSEVFEERTSIKKAKLSTSPTYTEGLIT